MATCKDDICIIPAPMFGEFLQGMKDRDEQFLESNAKLCQTQERLCVALERIASNMHETNVHQQPDDDRESLHNSLEMIGEKIDKLTEAVTTGASIVQKQSAVETDLKTAKENIKNIKDLRGKFLRSEKLSSYYEQLYGQE